MEDKKNENSSALNFTKTILDSLTFSKDKRLTFRDTKDRYLYLFITETKKSFYYYRKYDGRVKQFKLGDYPTLSIPQAREKVSEYNIKLSSHIDPVEERKEAQRKQQKEMTLMELFNIYEEHKKDSKRTIKDDRRKMNTTLKEFCNKKISNITYETVSEFHRSMKEHKYAANRMIAFLSALFTFAINKLRIEINNPCRGIEKYQEQARERFLKPEELLRFVDVLISWDECPYQADFSAIFKIMLYTGARKSNVLNMKFSDLDLIEGMWHISGEESKNKESLKPPLHPEALNILKARYDRLKDKSPYVFPSPRIPDVPIREIKFQWFKLLKESKLDYEEKSKKLRMHDVRRTFGSYALRTCKDMKTVQLALGHKSYGTTSKHYGFVLEDDIKSAVADIYKGIL